MNEQVARRLGCLQGELDDYHGEPYLTGLNTRPSFRPFLFPPVLLLVPVPDATVLKVETLKRQAMWNQVRTALLREGTPNSNARMQIDPVEFADQWDQILNSSRGSGLRIDHDRRRSALWPSARCRVHGKKKLDQNSDWGPFSQGLENQSIDPLSCFARFADVDKL